MDYLRMAGIGRGVEGIDGMGVGRGVALTGGLAMG
jgi:hypothetical protein